MSASSAALICAESPNLPNPTRRTSVNVVRSPVTKTVFLMIELILAISVGTNRKLYRWLAVVAGTSGLLDGTTGACDGVATTTGLGAAAISVWVCISARSCSEVVEVRFGILSYFHIVLRCARKLHRQLHRHLDKILAVCRRD